MRVQMVNNDSSWSNQFSDSISLVFDKDPIKASFTGFKYPYWTNFTVNHDCPMRADSPH